MTRSTKQRLVLLALVLCSSCLCCGGCWTWDSRPYYRFLRLLQGDKSVRVTRLTTTRHAPKPLLFDIDDPESLEYLTNAFRAAEPDGHVSKQRDDSGRSGPVWHVDVQTDWTGSYLTSFELPNDERINGMTVFCGLDDTYYF
jgi:hypothetical protein